MKILLTIILTLVLMATCTGCGKETDEVIETAEETVQSSQKEENEVDEIPVDEVEESVEEAEKSEEAEETKTEGIKKEETKKEETVNKEENKKPETKPETSTKPAETVKPAESATPATLGHTLLADFKAKAAAGMSAQEIADGLMQNPAILFAGGAMPVEEGLLSGFDNTEIKGFKEGSMFAPMIGSIAFVGYVFELSEGTDASAFVSTLEKNANLRWNICVEAEEMVTGVSGNKVFFVMCPKSLEQ